MGIPNSEVGYTSVTTRRGDLEVYFDMWWYWKKRTMRSAQNMTCTWFLSDNKILLQETEGKSPSVRIRIIQNMTAHKQGENV
jgi:hypothetical protein